MTNIITEVEQKIHTKKYFDAQKRYLDVANNASIGVVITATTKNLHLVAEISAEGKSWLDSYIGTTFSAEGTLLPTFNRYGSPTSPKATAILKENPTVDSLGTQRFQKLILGGTGGQSTGATSGDRVESIIEKGQTIYVELTNKAGTAKDVGIIIEWYEEDQVES